MSVQPKDTPANSRSPLRKALLIYNPTAGQRDRRSQMRELAASLERRGLRVINAPTGGPGHATEIVRSYLSEGLDVVAVCGGDGTISEAAGGLAGSKTPLAILPGGTSNVLVRELAIPLDLDKAADLLFEGVARPVRMFRQRRPFCCGPAGLDARSWEQR